VSASPLTEKPCFMCSHDILETDEVAVVPKAFVHGSCAKENPQKYATLSMMVPCCQARATLEMLRGCMLQKRREIPDTEVRLWDPYAEDGDGNKGVLYRYAFQIDGSITELKPPPKPKGPVVADLEPPPPARTETL
jgi:hypothetical protein